MAVSTILSAKLPKRHANPEKEKHPTVRRHSYYIHASLEASSSIPRLCRQRMLNIERQRYHDRESTVEWSTLGLDVVSIFIVNRRRREEGTKSIGIFCSNIPFRRFVPNATGGAAVGN